MTDTSIDHELTRLLAGPPPATIDDVLAVMRGLDAALPDGDGLKWFNALYMMVTEHVNGSAPGGGWHDPTWLVRLDVVFAQRYFTALSQWLGGSTDVARSWRALFDNRFTPRVERIQFALAGMNAHINYDLALALNDTNAELGRRGTAFSPEHVDYERVNDILETVLPDGLRVLATGVLGQAAQDTGRVGQLLAIWNVRAARDLAWDQASQLRALVGSVRLAALAAQDQVTGVLGRSLLLPV